ncbi:MAG: T9SS type A sorting domain-containing protein [Janthinobacterium lividum]
MKHLFTFKQVRKYGWLLALWLLPLLGRGQAPAWQQAFGLNGTSLIQATAANAAGDVYVTGYFVFQLNIGGTTLSNAGNWDVFVAKWSAATNDWAWAVAGGGTNMDYGTGIAVSGNNVYVTGSMYNNSSNTYNVKFGGVVANGLATAAGTDAFVVKYTDMGSSAAYGWISIGGGAGGDKGNGIAASGTSLYVTGSFSNNSANAQGVQFGGVPLNGVAASNSYDGFIAKFTDTGSTATCNWAVANGGTSDDGSLAIAVSGASVYIAGNTLNNSANSRNVRFGTVSLPGASSTESYDAFVAKYTDGGSTATCNWAVAGGGTGYDQSEAVAVSGTGVYVTGFIVNNSANIRAVQFGGVALSGASTANDQDVFVAKYTDAGSSATYNWAIANGGIGPDWGSGIAVSGTDAYVAGVITNDNANTKAVRFGSISLNGAGSQASYDLFAAKYSDAGASAAVAWATAGGGAITDYGYSIFVSGGRVGVGGMVQPPATFGSLVVSQASPNTGVLLWMPATVLPVRSSSAHLNATLYPNPATSTIAVQIPGEAQATQVQATLLNMLGQVLHTQTAPLPTTGTDLLLQVAGLGRGVCLLQLKTGTAISTQQVVLE